MLLTSYERLGLGGGRNTATAANKKFRSGASKTPPRNKRLPSSQVRIRNLGYEYGKVLISERIEVKEGLTSWHAQDHVI